MQVNQINAARAPKASGGYSQAVEIIGAKRMLFVSGQIPESSAGEIPPDFESQARLAWANLVAQLEAANMTVADLVKVTTFLASRAHAGANGVVRRSILGAHAPAITVIIAGIFDERWLLEIEATAAQ